MVGGVSMQQRWRNGRIVAGLLASLLSLAAIVWTMRAWSERRYQRHLQEAQYAPPPPGMVFVPAGEFLMGSDDPMAEPDERPLRKVFLPAVFIDRFEVTNRRYKEFKKDHQYPAGEDDLPASLVFKSDAEAYCQWAGKRLPTSAEWEKAARGTDGRRYPWGNEFSAERCNVKNGNDGSADGPVKVGSFPTGASPYGVEDMSGNVWEWVKDPWHGPSLFGFSSGAEPRGILRGGAHGYSSFQARTSYQGFEGLEATCHDVGFRCVMEATPLPASGIKR